MVDINSELSDSAFLLPLPTFVPMRYQPGSLANWSGHLAFANDLIAQHRPSILVELGTHHGESYFGMCQSVLANGVDCVCYAVDHWLGEEHAGKYGEEVFTDVNEYNQRLYKNFSYLLRATFDEARDQFGDGSIDLLHIDGLHTYDAGLHDFQHWFSKVRPGGVVLLHDVMVRHANFGIWKLWEELQHQYPQTFTFNHSWGLGVLRKPGSKQKCAALLELLFSASESAREQIHRHYVLYASYIDRLATKPPDSLPLASPPTSIPVAAITPDQRLFQVFLPELGGYSESASLSRNLPPDTWHTIEFELPIGVSGSIRIDPADRPCVLEINSIELIDSNLTKAIWAAKTPSLLKALSVLPTAMFLPQLDNCFVLSYGADPQIFLPDIKHDGPLRLVVSIRVSSDFHFLATALTPNVQGSTVNGNEVLVQVYSAGENGYTENHSANAHAEIGKWTTLTLDLKGDMSPGRIRLDPANIPCLVEIADFQIFESFSGHLIQSLQGAELAQLVPIDSAMHLPGSDRCLLFCFGDDPKLEFKPSTKLPGPVSVRVSLKIERRMQGLADLLKVTSDHSLNESKLAADIETLKVELRTSQSCRLLLAAELSQFATEKLSALREKDDAIALAEKRASQAQELLAVANAKVSGAEHEIAREQGQSASARQSLAQATAAIKSVEQSVSWRLTKPLRGIMRLLRGGASS